jgi:hypothetical protein
MHLRFTDSVMHSWEVLDQVRLNPSGTITAAFLGVGVQDFRSAGQYIACLPYGRNTQPSDPLIVVAEQHGTCSTKHAIMRRLAIEQKLPIALVLGIYEMTGENTPGVAAVLRRSGLTVLPEAHCYLRLAEKRIDLTHAISLSQANSLSFLHEEEIDPVQSTIYKAELHKDFLSQWIANDPRLAGRSLQGVWDVREQCIRTLELRASQPERGGFSQ